MQFTLLQKEVDYISERMELLLNHIKYQNLPHIPRLLQQRARTLIARACRPHWQTSSSRRFCWR
jgi:hypothetical protein